MAVDHFAQLAIKEFPVEFCRHFNIAVECAFIGAITGLDFFPQIIELRFFFTFFGDADFVSGGNNEHALVNIGHRAGRINRQPITNGDTIFDFNFFTNGELGDNIAALPSIIAHAGTVFGNLAFFSRSIDLQNFAMDPRRTLTGKADDVPFG